MTTIEIPCAPHNPYRQIEARYDYQADDGTKCPACGGLGMSWGGWFSCEGCYCIALVEDGRAFVPIETPDEKRAAKEAALAMGAGI